MHAPCFCTCVSVGGPGGCVFHNHQCLWRLLQWTRVRPQPSVSMLLLWFSPLPASSGRLLTYLPNQEEVWSVPPDLNGGCGSRFCPSACLCMLMWEARVPNQVSGTRSCGPPCLSGRSRQLGSQPSIPCSAHFPSHEARTSERAAPVGFAKA